MTLPNEEEFKMWMDEQVERIKQIKERFNNGDEFAIGTIVEKAVPPFHYWMQDRQKAADAAMSEMFEDNTPTMTHVLVKDGKKQTFPKKDMLKQTYGLRWDKEKRGWGGDIETSQLPQFKQDMNKEGFNVYTN